MDGKPNARTTAREAKSAERNGTKDEATMRIGALADLHWGRLSMPPLQPLLAQLNDNADVALLCGDLTDHGQPEEAQALAKELAAAVKIPMVGVLGNHDYHVGKQDEVRRIIAD